MSSKQVYFDEVEEKIIKFFSKKWNLPEYEVVRKIVREFKEKEVKHVS
jgi:hypothetical protein